MSSRVPDPASGASSFDRDTLCGRKRIRQGGSRHDRAERNVRAIFDRKRKVFATGLSVSRRLAELIRRAAGAATAPGDSVGSIAAVAIGLDELGMVILASADGECFRIVERLARDAKDAQTLYNESLEPTLDLDAVRVRYGPEIAVLRLI